MRLRNWRCHQIRSTEQRVGPSSWKRVCEMRHDKTLKATRDIGIHYGRSVEPARHGRPVFTASSRQFPSRPSEDHEHDGEPSGGHRQRVTKMATNGINTAGPITSGTSLPASTGFRPDIVNKVLWCVQHLVQHHPGILRDIDATTAKGVSSRRRQSGLFRHSRERAECGSGDVPDGLPEIHVLSRTSMSRRLTHSGRSRRPSRAAKARQPWRHCFRSMGWMRCTT